MAASIFFVGSTLAAASISIAMLIAARAIQGIGAGGLTVLVNICVGDLFSPRSRGKVCLRVLSFSPLHLKKA